MVIVVVLVMIGLAWYALRLARGASVSEDPRRIGLDEIGPYTVSTVDLTIEITGGRYETMVFLEGDPGGEYTRRYATREQAKAGHREMVTMITALASVIESRRKA